MNKGYIVSVTEYEQGWGCRPDGFLICADKEKGVKKSTEVGGLLCGDYREYSRVTGEFKLCILTEKGKKAIEKNSDGVIWVSNWKEYVSEL